MSVPDALDGADGNASGFRHHRAGPVRGLGGRVCKRQGDDPFGHVVAKRIDARWSRLVTKKAIEAFVHELLLPGQTQVFDFHVRRMISFVPIPSALSRTISGRQTCF